MLRQFPLGRTPFATPTGPPPAPRPAATVMLVRDRATSVGGVTAPGGPHGPSGVGDGAAGGRPGGVEVFVFRRVASMQFAAGMQVFPGGRVDERDADPTVPWHGPDPARFTGPLSAEVPLARALVVAAVRETFEECGVLLASRPDGDDAAPGPEAWDGALREWHRRMAAGEVALAEMLREEGLVLRADLLHPWAHWVTPPGEPRRYDTRFFVAEMPGGQQARDLGGEGEQARWLPAGEAVVAYRDGRTQMLPPTLVCVEELAEAASVAALLATPRRIRPVMPWPARLPDGRPAVEVDLDGVGGGEPRR